MVEAKAEDESAEAGLEQAKGYARDLGTVFAYATNGRDIIEYDVGGVDEMTAPRVFQLSPFRSSRVAGEHPISQPWQAHPQATFRLR